MGLGIIGNRYRQHKSKAYVFALDFIYNLKFKNIHTDENRKNQ